MIATCKPKKYANKAKCRQRLKWSGKCAPKNGENLLRVTVFSLSRIRNVIKGMPAYQCKERGNRNVQIKMKVSYKKNESTLCECWSQRTCQSHVTRHSRLWDPDARHILFGYHWKGFGPRTKKMPILPTHSALYRKNGSSDIFVIISKILV